MELILAGGRWHLVTWHHPYERFGMLTLRSRIIHVVHSVTPLRKYAWIALPLRPSTDQTKSQSPCLRMANPQSRRYFATRPCASITRIRLSESEASYNWCTRHVSRSTLAPHFPHYFLFIKTPKMYRIHVYIAYIRHILDENSNSLWWWFSQAHPNTFTHHSYRLS